MKPWRVGFMVVALSVLAYLVSQLMFLPMEEILVQIDIYEDRFEYRHQRYPSISALSIALEASSEVLEAIEVRECAALPKLQAVLETVQARGEFNVAIVIPETC